MIIGDALGTPGMCMERTIEELTALTDTVVIPVPLTRFGQLFDDHPRIMARFLLAIQCERIALMDQLTSMGRTSAEASLAAFIIDLIDRLEPLGLVRQDSFDMKVTQTQIGDLLGLTGVHVNRMMRTLEEQNLIKRAGQRLTVCDRQALAKLAARRPRRRLAKCSWLPQEHGTRSSMIGA